MLDTLERVQHLERNRKGVKVLFRLRYTLILVKDMEKIKSKIEKNEGGDFSSMLSEIGSRYYQEWRGFDKSVAKISSASIQAEIRNNLIEKDYPPESITDRVYLEALAGKYVTPGAEYHVSKNLSETQIVDLARIVERMVYQHKKPADEGKTAFMFKDLERVENTQFIVISRQLVDACYVLDTNRYATQSTKDHWRKSEELLVPENISTIFGLAKALHVEPPIKTSIAIDLLEMSRGLKDYSESLPNDIRALSHILPEQSILCRGLRVKEELKFVLERVFPYDLTKQLYSIALFSVLARGGEDYLTQMYKELGNEIFSPFVVNIKNHFVMPLTDRFENRYERVFWEIWNRADGKVKSRLTEEDPADPEMALKRIVGKLNLETNDFFNIAKSFPQLIDFLGNEKDKKFVKIVLEIIEWNGIESKLGTVDEKTRDYLTNLVDSVGGVEAFRKIRPDKIIKLIKDSPANLRHLILVGVAELNYKDDGQDYTRGASSRESGQRRRLSREEEKTDHFSLELERFGLPENQRGKILYCRDFMRSFSQWPDKKLRLLGKDFFDPETLLWLEDGRNEAKKTLRNLDDSAKGFDIYHRRLDKSRKIPPFSEIWSNKITEFMEKSFLAILQDRPNAPEDVIGAMIKNIYTECAELFVEGVKLYKSESVDIIPHLRAMNEFVNKKLFSQGIWFSGRDGVPLRLAVKSRYFGGDMGPKSEFKNIIRAGLFGNVERRKELVDLAIKERRSKNLKLPKSQDLLLEEGVDLYLSTDATVNDIVKMANISRLLVSNLKTDKDIERFKEYFTSLEINSEMLAVDTGYDGSVIRDSFMYLYGSVEDEDSHRVALLSLGTAAADIGHRRFLTRILDKGVADDVVDKIERLPKATDRYLYIDEETGKPIALPGNEDVKLLSWVAEHCIMRHLTPRPPRNLADLKEDAMEYVAIELGHVSEALVSNPSEVEEYQNQIADLYDISSLKIGPIFVSYADTLLRKASSLGGGGKVVFSSPNLYAVHKVATVLLDRFPERYPGLSHQDLLYIQTSESFLQKEIDSYFIEEYLTSEGIKTGEKIVLAGMGMFDVDVDLFKRIISKKFGVTVDSTEFLISKDPEVDGFLDDTKKKMSSLDGIFDNPVVHFLKDTFCADNGGYYPSVERLKRLTAIWGVKDYAESIKFADLDIGIDRQALDQFFLENVERFKEVGVPHES
ncbi:MAG: hypothetical protein HY226_04795 [Candidatus Vogelbacteria bacterium]|nr:hypothetical protein [Candidatus Vogelbacteria bacterium]